jgi:hypothetical protein
MKKSLSSLQPEAECLARRLTESYMKRESNSNLTGNEAYYTESTMLLVKNMLCT